MDENQTSDQMNSGDSSDSFSLASSMSEAANSIDTDNFAFLIVPIGVAILVAVILSLFLIVRRRQFKKSLASEIEAAVKSADQPNASASADDEYEVAESRGQWETPPTEDLSAEAEASDEEKRDSDWHIPTSPQESADVEDSLDFEASELSAAKTTDADEVSEIRTQSNSDWFARLKNGLARTRDALAKGLSSVLGSGSRLDEKVLESIHEQLYRADVGVKTCDRLVKSIESTIGRNSETSLSAVSESLRTEVTNILTACDRPLSTPANGPWVILVVGVNGVGKTTTIGKLSARFISEGKTVLLAAADTFRAAAIDQLQTWGQRLGIDVISHQAGSDPAAVAFDAVKAAQSRGHDVLIIDTAGRLHNKKELMDELGKINRVIGKDLPGSPHETWLVIDATTGQNANMQVAAFREVVKISGLIITKLDGTAKGGVVVGIADQHQIPIRFIGVGEKASDLRQFSAREFAETLI